MPPDDVISGTFDVTPSSYPRRIDIVKAAEQPVIVDVQVVSGPAGAPGPPGPEGPEGPPGTLLDLPSYTVAGNPASDPPGGSALPAAPAAPIPIGGVPAGGTFINGSGALVSSPPLALYYLSNIIDADGANGTTIVGASQPYLIATRTAVAGSTLSITGTVTGTSHVFANFITPPGDPGALFYPAGNTRNFIYAQVSTASGYARCVIDIYRRAVDGTETIFATSNSVSFNNTSTAPVPVLMNKLNANSLSPYDRLVFRISFGRVSGPASFDVTFTSNSATVTSVVSTTTSGTGSTVPQAGAINVRDYLAPFTARTYLDGRITAGSKIMTSAAASFTPGDKGKTLWLNGAGPGGITGTPAMRTIDSVTDANTIVLNAPADSTVNDEQVMTIAVPDDGTGCVGYYLPGVDTVMPVGGTYTTQAVCSVVATGMLIDESSGIENCTIVNPGAGGKPGTWIFTTTTQSGSGARIRVVIDSTGVATSVNAINSGVWVANPVDPHNEPLSNTDSGLVGLTIDITAIRPLTLLVVNGGNYIVPPPNDDDTPIPTTPGSVSGATGFLLNGTWQGGGEFLYGFNARDAFATAMSAANTVDATSRAILRVPAGDYLLDGAVLPLFNRPVLVVGDGRNQTNIFMAPTYAGPYVFAWTNMFPTGNVATSSSATGSPFQQEYDWGAIDVSISGNRLSPNKQNGYIAYDLCSNMRLERTYTQYINGSVLQTGKFSSSSVAYLRESYFQSNRMFMCGDAVSPVVDLDCNGATAGDNYLWWYNTQIVFPVGVPISIRNHSTKINGVKTMFFQGTRIERSASQEAHGPLVQLGGSDDINALIGIHFRQTHLVGIRVNTGGFELIGNSEKKRPRDIHIDDLDVRGPNLGANVIINSGWNVFIDGAETLLGRQGSVITGDHSDYRKITTATAATASTVSTAAGPSVVNGNTGAAVVHTVNCEFTGSKPPNSFTLTVTSVTSGRLLVGSVVTTVGRGALRIAQFLTGTGGTGTYRVEYRGGLPVFNTIPASSPLSATYTDSRRAMSYVVAGRVTTIGSLQGSNATWDNIPLAGERIAFESLIDRELYVFGRGQERGYKYDLGLGVEALMSRSLLVFGVPLGMGSIRDSLTFEGDTRMLTTPTFGDNSTKLATTAFVQAAVAGSVAGVSSFNARTGAVTLLSADVTGALGYTPLSTGGGTLTGPLILPVGSAAATSLNFGTAGTGLFGTGTNTVGISASGTVRLSVTNSGIFPTVPVLASSGSVGAPGYSFGSETNAGIYRPGAGVVAMASAGVDVMRWTGASKTVNFFGPAVLNADGVGTLEAVTVQQLTAGLATKGSGTMTSLVAGTNLTGGTISTAGTIGLSLTPTITDPTAKLTLDRNATGTIVGAPDALVYTIGPDANVAEEVVETYNNTATFSSRFIGRRARGTRGSPTAVQGNFVLAAFGGSGWDGTSFQAGNALAAVIRMVASETWTSSAHGARMEFLTTTNGGTGLATSMTLAPTTFGVSATTMTFGGTRTLTVGGNITFAGSSPVTINNYGTSVFSLPLTEGTAGQVLTSGGPGAAATWGAGGSGIGTIVAGGILSGGTITSAGTIGLVVGAGLTSAATGTISLLPATTAALGGVIAGSGITIDVNGTISTAGGGGGMSGPIVAASGLAVSPASSGGTITSSGTLLLATIPAYSVLATGSLGGRPGAVLLDTSFDVNGGSTLTLLPATSTQFGGIKVNANGLTINAGGTLLVSAATTAALGGVLVPASGGLTIASGTLTNAGVISIAGGTGTLTLGTGITRTSQALNLQPATTAAIGGVITSTGISNSSGTISNAGVLSIDTATGAILIGTGLVRSGQTISTSNTIVVGLANDLTNTLPLGTYDLGPFPQGGTILNGYAHVSSGTLTYGAAIGAPGTYTDVTGLTAVAVSAITSDTTSTPSGAFTISAGAHAYIKVTGTAAAGAVAFLRVKVP